VVCHSEILLKFENGIYCGPLLPIVPCHSKLL
jgi:hypothetical protein